MRLLLTRPEADAAGMCAALEAAGHSVVVEPLLRVEPLPGPPIDVDGVQALIATSRNALRALAARGEPARRADVPLFAVGPGTAALARAQGFSRVIEGPAGARELPGVIVRHCSPDAGILLHLAGARLAFDLAGALAQLGFTVRVEAVYSAVAAAAALSPGTRDALAAGRIDAVVLMSPATAERYVALVRGHGLEHMAHRPVHLCLSAAVAGRLAPLAGARAEVALRPNAQEMLALIARVAAQSTKKVNSP